MKYPKRSQYKYAKSRYRVRNWAEYEAGQRWPGRESEPQEDQQERPLATERQKEAETGVECGPTADPPKGPTESESPTSA